MHRKNSNYDSQCYYYNSSKTNRRTSLYWKIEHDDGVSDVSSEKNIITQDDPKAASLATANKETTINAAAQEESVDEVHGTMENWSVGKSENFYRNQ
jgi:hypothetical protein